MENFSGGPDLQDLLELDSIGGEDVKMDEVEANAENPHDVTDDALETILMEEEAAMKEQTGFSAPQASVPQKVVVNLPESKVVMASQPIQVVSQQKSGTVVTKFILKKTNSHTSKPTTTFTVSASGQAKAPSTLQTVTLPRNNITLSPIKGGFKIPISPLKNSLKVQMIPASSSNNAVRTINISQQIAGRQAPVQSNSNFQFQALVPAQNNRVNISNPQIIQQQSVNIQQQLPAGRLQCVRLMPAGNGQSTSTAGLTNFITGQGNSTLPVGATIMQPQRVQPFVNIQSLQKPVQQQPIKTQRLIMPATTIQQNQPTVANLSPGSVLQAGNVGYAMVPAKYVEQLKKQLNSQLVYNQDPLPTLPTEPIVSNQVSKVTINGKVRKPCNCTKSMCLKLYCECFANGHFCDGCNCINCHNNLDYDGDRSKAIKSCLERNPMAFRPKIGRGRDDNRTHQKGCNCKRSGCLKNYCECYEARIPCTSKCKCIGCKNLEEDSAINNEQHSLMNLADAAAVRCQQQAAARSRINSQIIEMRPVRPKGQHPHSATGEKLPCTFFTQEVIEATCTCMLAQAEEAEKTNRSIPVAEMMILEEFGRCLMQIIQAAGKAKTTLHP